MYSQVKNYIESCEQCQRAKNPAHTSTAPLHPMPPVSVFERWHMDIIGPLTQTAEKFKYILVCVDSFSRFVEAFPLLSQETTEVARIFYKEIICRYGAPLSLVTDRGKTFMSNVMTELCRLMDIKKFATSSYHPQTNSTCERFNRTLAQSLRSYIDEKQQLWADLLPGILMAYRKADCTNSTKFSPYELVFGKDMKGPFDISFEFEENSKFSKPTLEYLQNLKENMKLTQDIAKKNVDTSQQRYKAQYDNTNRAKEPSFHIGDRVWLYSPKIPLKRSAKLHPKWTGPYYIADLGPNHTYKIRHCITHKQQQALVHANRLKKYNDPETRDERFPSPPFSLDNAVSDPVPSQEDPVSNNSEYDKQDTSTNLPNERNREDNNSNKTTQSEDKTEWGIVDKLIAASRHRGKKVYKVKWRDQTKTTWEPAENLPPFLIREFHIDRTLTGRKRKRR